MKSPMSIAVVCVTFSTIAADPASFNVWSPQTSGATPLDASSYATAANWQDQAKGAPLGNDAVAVFGSPAGSDWEYVALPDDFVIGAMANDSTRTIRLLGKEVTIDASKGFTLTQASCSALTGGNLVAGRVRMNSTYNSIWADSVVATGGGLSGMYMMCAPLCAESGLSITVGKIVHDMRWYATSSSPVRSGEMSVSGNFTIGTSFEFYAPKPAGEKSGVWAVSHGKTFARYVSGTTYDNLCPGAVVTSDAFPSGTYLKRIFDANWIELSAAALMDASEGVALSFAACRPVVTNYIACVNMGATSQQQFKTTKYEKNQEYLFVVDKFTSGSGAVVQSGLLTFNSGYYPATFVIKDGASYTSGLKLSQVDFVFDTCGGTVVSGFPNAREVQMASSGCTTSMSVGAGDAAEVANVKTFAGSFEKKGEGALTLRLADSAESIPKISASAGTLNLSAPVDGWSVANLSVAQGAKACITGGHAVSVTGGDLSSGAVLAAGADSRLELGESVQRTVCGLEANGNGRIVIGGTAALDVSSLAGLGCIDGSIKTAENAEISVDVEKDGPVGELTVTGSADLSNGGTVVVAGLADKLRAGSYRIMTASSMVGGDWTVRFVSAGKRKISARVSDGALWLDVVGPGLILLLK